MSVIPREHEPVPPGIRSNVSLTFALKESVVGGRRQKRIQSGNGGGKCSNLGNSRSRHSPSNVSAAPDDVRIELLGSKSHQTRQCVPHRAWPGPWHRDRMHRKRRKLFSNVCPVWGRRSTLVWWGLREQSLGPGGQPGGGGLSHLMRTFETDPRSGSPRVDSSAGGGGGAGSSSGQPFQSLAVCDYSRV